MVSDSKMVFQPGNKKIVGKLWEKISLWLGESFVLLVHVSADELRTFE